MCKIQQNRRWSLVKSVPYVLEWPRGGESLACPLPRYLIGNGEVSITNRPKIHLHHRRSGLAFTSREDERFSLRMDGRKQHSRIKIDVLQVSDECCLNLVWGMRRLRGCETFEEKDAYKLELGTFPKAFSQVATSQMCNFPSGNFPKVRPSEVPQAAMGAERCG